MDSTKSNLLHLLVVALVAAIAFLVGYFAPHHFNALAQSPNPASAQNVPRGVGGHGLTTITGVAPEPKGSGWPCSQQEKCLLNFDFRFSPKASVALAMLGCGSLPHCVSFNGSDFYLQLKSSSAANPSATYEHVNVMGRIQLVGSK